MDVTPTIQHLHGRIQSITGTDPAAGAEISITVPARRRWRLLALTFGLVTDATVIDRLVVLAFDDGTNIFSDLRLTKVQAASLTYSYTFVPNGAPEVFSVDTIIFPLPLFLLAENFRIRTITTGLQAGDNFGIPQFLVEKWIDP